MMHKSRYLQHEVYALSHLLIYNKIQSEKHFFITILMILGVVWIR